ncbi:MAG: hypothetical protein IT204_13450 [Fimbriimonadaceae bacterium]|nr:hypothetical protein [Fimbriimonadaceae bacterium]
MPIGSLLLLSLTAPPAPGAWQVPRVTMTPNQRKRTNVLPIMIRLHYEDGR